MHNGVVLIKDWEPLYKMVAMTQGLFNFGGCYKELPPPFLQSHGPQLPVVSTPIGSAKAMSSAEISSSCLRLLSLSLVYGDDNVAPTWGARMSFETPNLRIVDIA